MTASKRAIASAVFALALGMPALAFAGEVKIGAAPLDTDDAGKLTAAGRQAAVDTLPSRPGEELWVAHVWAKIDKGAPGPLYIEFIGQAPGGKKYTALRYEKPDYEGEEYVSAEIELDGNQGFNKGKSYDIKVVQVGDKGGDIVLGQGKITLQYVEAKPEDEDDEGGGDTESAMDDQDALDTLAGGEEGGGKASDGPPPVDAKGKKGCAIDPAGFGGFSGLMLLFAVGAMATRRRRD